MTVYALLVGIDAYPGQRLAGAVADVTAAAEHLADRVPGAAVSTLHDGEATRAAVVDGFRTHLAQAGPGDVALFWFAGHGRRAPVPHEHRWLEPGGELQTLVCADSDGWRVPDLLDKEVSLLLAELVARGPHVVVVLDSCRSGGATRDLPGSGETIRSLGPAGPAAPGAYLPGLDGHVPADPGGYVLLAACAAHELAREVRIGGRIRGVFSHALLRALRTAGPDASYRDLITVAQGTVHGFTTAQTAVLLPAGPGLADSPFLGGAAARPTAFRLRTGPRGWEVDAGRCHGLPAPTPDAPVTFAVPRAHPDGAGRLVRVDAVGAATSTVIPLGWRPDPGRAYPLVPASVPSPPCGLVVGGGAGDDPAAVERVRRAVGRAGPDGGPSPDVRLVAADEPVAGPRLWISAPVVAGRAVLRLLRADGTPATADVDGHGDASARTAVAHAVHIARWEALLRLDNPLSGLTGAVGVEVVPADGAATLPDGRAPLLPDAGGRIALHYRRAGAGWQAPEVFVRLHNTAGRPLWCVLLDLTDRYRSTAALFPGAFVAAGGTAAALEGQPIRVSLPDDRPAAPGTAVRDWLKLIVAEQPVNELAFTLPALGEAPLLHDGTRDFTGAARRPGDDWTTALLPIVTTVPGPDPRPTEKPVAGTGGRGR